jgi:UDP-N-acetylmuramoyl-tripeptide--D-alanyl-D-alanine ligase
VRIALDVVGALALATAFASQMLRWLRVLQREHYEPQSMRRFLGRWSSPQVALVSKSTLAAEQANHRVLSTSAGEVGNRATSSKLGGLRRPTNLPARRPITLSQILILALLVTAVLNEEVALVIVGVLYGLFCPQGLSIKGRTGALRWTRRATTIAVVATVVSLAFALLGAFSKRPWFLAVAVVWAVPVMLHLTARVLGPLEDRRANSFVKQATTRLQRVAPTVVAITGSFGKTSTKSHLVDLMRADGGVVASPKSFNNRAGLSRTINENLADGTRIFIAEMGTYGPGEIRALCSWCVPDIAVVTAIGPVHLERMKTIEVIEAAKFEITEKAKAVVLNIDDPTLARWPARLGGKRVRTAGSRVAEASVRVAVEGATWTLSLDGVQLGAMDAIVGVQPTNLACALAVALELGVAPDALMARARVVTSVDNRANVVTAASGVIVIDDTFNANPVSAMSALNVLGSLALTGRRVVVTPGLVELGTEQYGENLALARKASFMGAELVIVARTNAVPLTTGFDGPVRRFNTRDEAVTWVRTSLVAGDGVLYLNDLPDHYP